MALYGGVSVVLTGATVLDKIATVLAFVVGAGDLHLVLAARGAEASPVLCDVILYVVWVVALVAAHDVHGDVTRVLGLIPIAARAVIGHVAAGNTALSLDKSVTLVALVAVEITVLATTVLTIDILTLTCFALVVGNIIVPIRAVTTGQVRVGLIDIAAVASCHEGVTVHAGASGILVLVPVTARTSTPVGKEAIHTVVAVEFIIAHVTAYAVWVHR